MTKAKDKSSTPASFGGVASWDGTAGSSSRYQPKSASKPKELTEKEIAARRAEGKKLLKILGGELSGWYSAKRLWTGKDPVTGETANRWFAAGELGLDLASYMILFAKAGKAIKAAQTAGKVIDTLDNVSDASKALKAVDTVDDTKDALKVAGIVDEASDIGRGVGNPVSIAGRGSTGRTIANTLNEQLAMQEVMSNPLAGAFEIPITMTDPRWMGTEGWVKMQRIVTLSDGTKVNIHYVYNKLTGAFDDFKFK
ncbi:hypothetical protein IR123_10595 [Streptococcus sp. 19428wC2_LYSM12]|uniref:pre-toxin TG domain-containing protein n=1 Tax=unclassified Streptococcus TaxID=2608887 RepID=UPI001071E3F2|nr:MULTISPECIES: pre-toxin TG domain-containing protein [unclassified Streptococcus]MBF0788318.1 hypothetical protein [Streptococcus sp. 19428wC2_LYSM12]TFV04579.1 hypothetical protein E4T79_10545 [Streptococcus sp. LYSM12]